MKEKEFKRRYISRLMNLTASVQEYQWMRDSAKVSWQSAQEDPDEIRPEDSADDEMSS